MLRIAVKESIVKAVGLKKKIATRGKVENKLQRVADLHSIHMLYILNEDPVDVPMELKKTQVITRRAVESIVARTVVKSVGVLNITGDKTPILHIDKLNNTVNKVAKIGEELGIVPLNKLGPRKHRIRDFGTRY